MSQPPSAADTPWRRSAESLGPVERFIHEVLPTIPGPHLVPETRRYPALIRRAARDRGLSIKTIQEEEYLYDGPIPVGGVKPTMSTLNSPEAKAISWSSFWVPISSTRPWHTSRRWTDRRSSSPRRRSKGRA